MSLKFH